MGLKGRYIRTGTSAIVNIPNHAAAAATATFRTAFGKAAFPTRVSRAPGRVNLIGEHTDYNGLPVLPMALGKEIRVFFRTRDDSLVRVANTDPEFRLRSFRLSTEIPSGPQGDWGNYLKAPCQSLTRRFGSLRGMDAVVTSSLPVASGLSSSSALVIAMGQALLHGNDLTLPTLELAEAMARAERYTGTQGGGMDQAIALGALAGHASRIEFDPLRLFPIPIPPYWRFVVAHTLVRAEKSGAAQTAYNERTRECREALDLLREDPNDTLTYPQLLARRELSGLLDTAARRLPESLFRRFRHVVTEGRRVYEAEIALREGSIRVFGDLMNASHESLRLDYEVSSPELDLLVACAREAGAVGARLTGAGFGGCVVALIEAGGARPFLETLEAAYYRERHPDVAREGVLFIAEASSGATVEALGRKSAP